MNPDPENFASLQKLLSLKRLEQPPPGYFDGLADRITCRIEMGEGRSSFWDQLAVVFSNRPILAYGMVLTLCGTLTCTAIYSFRAESMEPTPDVSVAAVESWSSPTPALAIQVRDAQPRVLHVPNWTGKNGTLDELTPAPAHSLFQPQPVRMMVVPTAYDGN